MGLTLPGAAAAYVVARSNDFSVQTRRGMRDALALAARRIGADRPVDSVRRAHHPTDAVVTINEIALTAQLVKGGDWAEETATVSP